MGVCCYCWKRMKQTIIVEIICKMMIKTLVFILFSSFSQAKYFFYAKLVYGKYAELIHLRFWGDVDTIKNVFFVTYNLWLAFLFESTIKLSMQNTHFEQTKKCWTAFIPNLKLYTFGFKTRYCWVYIPTRKSHFYKLYLWLFN